MQQSTKWPIGIEVLFAFFVFVFIAYRDILDLSFSGTVSAGLISLMVIVLPYTRAIPFLFFILPFTCGIPGYTVLLAYIFLIIKARKYDIWQFLPPFILGALEFVHITFSNVEVNVVTSISFLSFIALFFFLLFDPDERVDRRSCIRMFIYGTLAVLVIIYIGIIENNGFEELLSGVLRSAMEFKGLEEEEVQGSLVLNANSIAYYSITAFSLLLLGNRRLKINRIIYFCLIGLSVLTGALSFSRTWMAMFFFVILFFLLATTNKIKSFIIVGVMVFIVFVFYYSYLDSIWDVFMSRVDDENFKTAGGRTTIFAVYNEFWLSKISYVIWGAGAMCYKHIINFDYSMHNGLQQIYVSYGIVGIVLFATVICLFARKYITNRRSLILYIPFITCFLFDQSIQFWDPYYLIFPFVTTAYVLRLK